MALGRNFPRGMAEASVLRQLVPGAVIKLERVMDDGEIHEKRFLVLRVTNRTVTCVINSQISRFISARAELLRCQVDMPASDHAFMDHDSHIDCSRVREYETTEVVNDLIAHPAWILGQVATSLHPQITAALKHSSTIAPAEVGDLCSPFEITGNT
jgi:hypothetical protein